LGRSDADEWSGRSRGWSGPARDADVVHTHLWAGDQWGRVAARVAGRPVVSTIHNTEGDGPLRDRIARLTAPLATLVGASEAVADRLRSDGFSRVRSIPNGIDLARFTRRPGVPERARRIVGVGRLTRQKGFDVLVEAVRGTELDVTLVGEGEDRSMLAGASLVGWQPDVARYLREADIVAIPSRWEGFGLQAVEAMASGVPIVASDIPPLREVLGDAAVFVPPGDPGAWRSALVELAPDRARRSLLRERGLAPRARVLDRTDGRALHGALRGSCSDVTRSSHAKPPTIPDPPHRARLNSRMRATGAGSVRDLRRHSVGS
jgi:glycosyltransferase involved in cell wall biosynthesis